MKKGLDPEAAGPIGPEKRGGRDCGGVGAMAAWMRLQTHAYFCYAMGIPGGH